MFSFLIRSRNMRELGFLPYPGSYMQQPATLIQAWDVIDSAIAEADRLKDKKQKAMDAARGARR